MSLTKLSQRSIVLFLWLALLSGCAVSPVVPVVTNLPRHSLQTPLVINDRPVIAFVLGSGGIRGFAHIGVLTALEENGISADIVVGTSAGSVVGALYAGGIRGDALVEAAQQMELSQLTDWTFPNRGVIRGERLQLYVNQQLQSRPIEALPTRFVAVVTDLERGELVSFNHGDTGMAVRASSTIPGLVQPLMIGDRDYIDGALVSPVPIHVARELGADIVIAVDVSRTLFTAEHLKSTFAVMQQTMIIMSRQIARREASEADITIKPDVGEIKISQFDLRDQALAAGEVAAIQAMPDIKRRITEITRIKRGQNK